MLLVIFLISLLVYFLFNHTDSSIIYINGRLCLRNMIKNKYSINRLYIDLKNNKISLLNKNLCILLINNKPVFYYQNKEFNRPISIIINGEICFLKLKQINKDVSWLDHTLITNNINLENILYAFYQNNRLFIIKKVGDSYL